MARPSVPFGRLNTATKIAVGVGILTIMVSPMIRRLMHAEDGTIEPLPTTARP